jgi:hypothetical protein
MSGRLCGFLKHSRVFLGREPADEIAKATAKSRTYQPQGDGLSQLVGFAPYPRLQRTCTRYSRAKVGTECTEDDTAEDQPLISVISYGG